MMKRQTLLLWLLVAFASLFGERSYGMDADSLVTENLLERIFRRI